MATKYITWADVVNRYANASQKGGSTEMSAAFIAGSEAEIDGYLLRVTTLPLASVPDLVKDIAIDLTYWKMIWRDKEAKILRESIDARLKGIADGTIGLVIDGEAIGWPNNAWAENDYPSVFGADNPIRWQESTAAADDAENSRD